jgi:hypothetical protein
VLCGPVFFGWLGGQGEVLHTASGYGQVLFSGAMLVWLCNTLASVVRGTGNMRVPSSVVFAVAVLQIAVGGALGLGLGPFPRWGMTGVAVGNIVAMACGVLVLLAYLQWGQSRVRIPGAGAAVLADVQGHSAGGGAGLPVAGAVGADRADHDRPGGTVGAAGAGGLRHRPAAGVFADPDCLWRGRGVGAHGGHGHGGGPGAAHGAWPVRRAG